MTEQQFAVIGHPIGHTMSPFIHSRLFSLSGKKAEYAALDIPDISSPAALSQLRELSGFNITIPHKQAIIPFLQRLDPKAQIFGSVNTVKNENGSLCGYTTDGLGFLKAIHSSGVSPNGRILLLGCGGAARAIAFELAPLAKEIVLCVRSKSLKKAQILAGELLSFAPDCHISCIDTAGEEAPGEFDLLVNATPAGMFPNTGDCPASQKVIERCSAVFDAIYNPEWTKLLQIAQANGSKAVGGMSMLVWQAVAAHEIWDGSQYRIDDILQLCCDASREMDRIFLER